MVRPKPHPTITTSYPAQQGFATAQGFATEPPGRQPQIIIPDPGLHNKDLDKSTARLIKGGTYKDVSTIIITPTIGMVHARVIQSWFSMMTPMNQRVLRLFAWNMEVGKAYSDMIEVILNNNELRKWKYVLTMEDDNIPPPDGLIKLYESISGGADGTKGYDAVGALYWTKGEGGQPMIYGNPAEMPKSFRPQPPKTGMVQPCNGLGMGFTLFRMEMLQDTKIPKPLFRTAQDYIPYQGVKQYTQDLWFFENAGAMGYKFACDTRVLVGHYDKENDKVW